MDTSITVAICTYKRYSWLKGLVKTLENQTLPHAYFNVLVVDNNDDPSEREQFARDVAGWPSLQVVTSSPPGLSRARNVAIEKCLTEYIVFIDDDAFPEPGWLDALLSGFRKSNASVIAGPIVPVWPKPRPDWLPEKYLACLTVLDHGAKDRLLSEYEFAYGTNMAFRTSALREVGGFSAVLGRTGSKTLISDEEIEVQLALRARGHKIYYASRAAVSHRVHENRLNRNYFRARMAWQAVSALMHESPLWDPAHSMQELARASRVLAMEKSLSALFSSHSPNTFAAQIDLLYHLFLLILNANGEDDLEFENQFAVITQTTHESDGAENEPINGAGEFKLLRRVVPIDASTRHLFVEGYSSHGFLLDEYGNLPKSQLIFFRTNLWQNCAAELKFLEASLCPNLKTLTFITLEPLAYGPSSSAMIEFLDRLEISAFGFLHRLPNTPEQNQSLRKIAKRMKKIIVLAEGMERQLRSKHGIENIVCLPLHPTHHPYINWNRKVIREKLGVKKDQIVFSVLGEARKGKGIELLLASLKHIPKPDRERMFFIFGGRAADIAATEVEQQLKNHGVSGFVDLRKSESPLKFDVLNDREFGSHISASDVGLLLYQWEQRSCMSGVLPNYVWGRIPVIATEDSIVGQQILNYGNGLTIKQETPESLADALRAVLNKPVFLKEQLDRFETLRLSLAPSSIIETLKNILDTGAEVPISQKTMKDSEKKPIGLDLFEKYLTSIPNLHSWDKGETWNSGGFERWHLEKLHKFLKMHLPRSPVMLETGAGNSTISFLFLEPERLISIAPDAQLFERIRSYCDAERIPITAIEAHVDGSEWVLPKMAAETRNIGPILDFGLIDGCHGWPMVFVDFCYLNQMLKAGGYIMIDDVQLHSVKELARMLFEQPGFELALDLGKSLVFRKVNDVQSFEPMADWTTIPYIVRKTNEYSKLTDPFAL